MKKTTAKEKLNKKQKIGSDKLTGVADEEIAPISQIVSELDPEIAKVLAKPKKSKPAVDINDYIPELERTENETEEGGNVF